MVASILQIGISRNPICDNLVGFPKSGHICLSRRFKEDLAWAIVKRLQVISNKMLFKTVIPL